MNYALTGGPNVYSVFAPASKADFITKLKALLISCNWTTVGAIAGGWRMQATSPQLFSVYLDIWDNGAGTWVKLQFSSAVGSGAVGYEHRIDLVVSASFQFVGCKAHFFLSVPSLASDARGSAICGGIPYMDSGCGFGADAITEVWFSFGDRDDNVLGAFAAANPRTNLRTFIPGVTSQTYPCTGCYNGVVTYQADNSKAGVPQIFPIESAHEEDTFTIANNSHPIWYDGTDLKYPAFIGWGATATSAARIKGQLYDAVCRSKSYAMDALETFDGFQWMNWTDQWFWGSLWLLKGGGISPTDLVLNVAF